MSKRTCQWTVLLTFAALPLLIWAAVRVETNTDDAGIWIPDGTPERQAYQEFTSLFGNDGEVVLSWSGCTTDDPRLTELASRLETSNDQSHCFSNIVSGQSMLRDLAGKSFSFSEKSLRRRLDGIFFADQDQSTAIVVQMSPAGRENGLRCIEEIYRQVELTEGLSASDLHIGGDVYTTVQIDRSTNRALFFAFPSIILATLITFVCLRSIPLTIATLFTAGLSGLISVALVSIFGFKINGLLVIMPILVLVLSLSATVHLCSYYKCAVRSMHADPVRRMLEIGCKPCLLAVLTTAIGVGMLYTSHIQAARTFGLFSAMGLFASLMAILIVFPAILRIWPPTKSITSPLVIPLASKHRVISVWAPARFATATALVCIAAIPVFAFGLSQLVTTMKPERMFPERHIVNQHREWLNARFSGMNSIDVVVAFDKKNAEADYVNQIHQLSRIQCSLSKLEEVLSTFSIANICRLPSETRSAKSIMQKDITNDALLADQETLINHRLLASSDELNAWRIRLGLRDVETIDHSELVSKIEAESRFVTSSMANPPKTWATGIWLLSATGRNYIIRDLATSFVLAFIFITPIVMIVLRGFTVGLIAMIPNILPAMTFFGTIGLLGIEIDIGTLLTASVGLGIAVDDTLHFLHAFVHARKTNSLRSATVIAIRQCWRPMLYTTLICAGGLGFFVFSEFLPAQQFSLAIVALLILAVICDLLVLPALIYSPLGRFFERSKSTRPAILDPAANETANALVA